MLCQRKDMIPASSQHGLERRDPSLFDVILAKRSRLRDPGEVILTT